MFSEFIQEQMLLFIALAVILAMLAYSYLGDKIAGYNNVGTAEATRLFNIPGFRCGLQRPVFR